MGTESFTVKGSPKAVAQKALGLMKRARLKNFKLKESGMAQRDEGFVASARWEEDAMFFAGSVELRVEARRAYDGGATQVVIEASDDRGSALTARLRRSL